mmetsp:Transcript_29479/g.83145  ORF Transcript_29479/g.83145 Transcript_29479/m.83145 type:complete len:135 (+) Transcript_29479:1144-1548(+)
MRGPASGFLPSAAASSLLFTAVAATGGSALLLLLYSRALLPWEPSAAAQRAPSWPPKRLPAAMEFGVSLLLGILLLLQGTHPAYPGLDRACGWGRYPRQLKGEASDKPLPELARSSGCAKAHSACGNGEVSAAF